MRIKANTLNTIVSLTSTILSTIFSIYLINRNNISSFVFDGYTVMDIEFPLLIAIMSAVSLFKMILQYLNIRKYKCDYPINTDTTKKKVVFVSIFTTFLLVVMVFNTNNYFKYAILINITINFVVIFYTFKYKEGIYGNILYYHGAKFKLGDLEKYLVIENDVTLFFVKSILFLDVLHKIELESESDDTDKFVLIIKNNMLRDVA